MTDNLPLPGSFHPFSGVLLLSTGELAPSVGAALRKPQDSPDGSGLEPDRPYALARPVHEGARTVLYARCAEGPAISVRGSREADRPHAIEGLLDLPPKSKCPSWNPCGPSRGGCGTIIRVPALPISGSTDRKRPHAATPVLCTRSLTSCPRSSLPLRRPEVSTAVGRAARDKWSLRRGSNPHLRRSQAHNRGSRGTTSLT